MENNQKHTKKAALDATHWSTRTLAHAQGVSQAGVARIWDAHGLQPHRIETFKLSKDKRCVETLTDVVGVYLNPPDKAVALGVDEKSPVHAVDRTQPGLPMQKGRCGTMTHAYKRHAEFLKFLRTLDRDPSPGQALPFDPGQLRDAHPPLWQEVAGKPSTLSSARYTDEWPVAEPRRAVRSRASAFGAAVFTSVPELVAAIEEFIRRNNKNPKPFEWTKTVDDILRKIRHCKAVIETPH